MGARGEHRPSPHRGVQYDGDPNRLVVLGGGSQPRGPVQVVPDRETEEGGRTCDPEALIQYPLECAPCAVQRIGRCAQEEGEYLSSISRSNKEANDAFSLISEATRPRGYPTEHRVQ
jgi:hypothetical protein